MKKLFKSLILTLLALAMVLNTCGIALASDADAKIVLTEEVVEGDVSKLVVNLKTPTGATKVQMLNIVFSYDESKIALVDCYDYSVEITDLTEIGYAVNTIQNGRTTYTALTEQASVNGRTVVALTLSDATAKNPLDATAGKDVAEIYFKYKDKATDAETIKLETDTADGSLLATIYPIVEQRIPAFVQSVGLTYYYYGAEAENTLEKPVFTYTGSDIVSGPTTYDVTVAEYANGYVKADAALTDVEADTVINFEFTPHMGYALTSLKVNEVESINAVVNGRYALTVAADTTVAAEFTAVAADVDGDVFTASKVYDIAADADAALDKEKGASKLTFGKAIEVAGKKARNMGMEVQVKEGDTFVDYATPKGVGPKYRAHTPVNNQFGIRFFSFPAGTYRVRSYVDYEDLATGALGESIYGEYVEFTVE